MVKPLDVDLPHVNELLIKPFASCNCNIVELTAKKLMMSCNING